MNLKPVWRVVGMVGLAVLVGTGILIFAQAPRMFYGLNHPVNLLFYFHVSVAWVGFAGLLVSAIAGGLFLLKEDRRYVQVAAAVTRVSFVFISLTLLTGMVWGKFIWNSWWEWSDVRLVTALMVWFIYAGYLMHRSQAREARDDRRSAVYSLLAFISVPITFAATRLWQSPFHGTTMGTGKAEIMLPALVLTVIGMTLFYTYLVALRCRVDQLFEALADARRSDLL